MDSTGFEITLTQAAIFASTTARAILFSSASVPQVTKTSRHCLSGIAFLSTQSLLSCPFAVNNYRARIHRYEPLYEFFSHQVWNFRLARADRRRFHFRQRAASRDRNRGSRQQQNQKSDHPGRI